MTVYSRAIQEHISYRFPGREAVTEPPYNILSYTWGRFKARDGNVGSALEASGIEWDIPGIDATRAFSAEEFRDVLQRVAGENNFVWVDVACIDQRKDSEEYKEEIGNQVGIFHRAQSAFIWLHQLSTEQLREGIDAVRRAKEAQNATGDQVRKIEVLCRDPWFSSLWTLQEAYLRKSAILLSNNGTAVFTSSGTLATLQWLVDYCEHPWAQAAGYIKQVIQTSGLDRLAARNPVVLLAAARYRETTRPLDRVYGIMQVFGLKLGQDRQSSRADRRPEPRLSDLEVELSQELNIRSPALAQTFIHVERAAVGQAWRLQLGVVTPATRSQRKTFLRPGLDLTQIVPPDFFNVQEVQESENRARIFFVEGLPIFEGYSIPLESLLAMWQMELPADQPDPQIDEWMPYMNDLTHSIYMDNVNDVRGMERIRSVPPDPAFMNYNRPLILAQDLTDLFPQRLRTLILGKLTDGKDQVFVGIIAMRETMRENATPAQWRRIGICTWLRDPRDLKKFVCFLG
jgi:hypothetical protein